MITFRSPDADPGLVRQRLKRAPEIVPAKIRSAEGRRDLPHLASQDGLLIDRPFAFARENRIVSRGEL